MILKSFNSKKCNFAIRKFLKMDKIPSVDLRDFLSDNPERKQKFVNEIGKAYEEIGFVALKGHFLDDNLVEDLYGEVKNFLTNPWKRNKSMRFQELGAREVM